MSTEPVVGAVWAAMEEDGLTVSGEMHERMAAYREFDAIPYTLR
ncbi:hypothetical protein [Paenibacillus rubinfantis]|nr:hypothetical protein [Paenibacillus rubinfantis]